MDIELRTIGFKGITTMVLTILLISGTIITAASSYLTGSVYGQLPPQGDADGDGLINTWETNGIPIQGGGTYMLPGANPNHKNLYVEVDFMEFHRPVGGINNRAVGGSALDDVKRAFSSAPVTNPDGINGINLFIQLDDQIPHQDQVTFEEVATILKPAWFGTAAERTDPNSVNLRNAKQLAFHYTIFAHNQPGGFDGIASLPGPNILITLGGSTFARDPVTDHPVGTRSYQAQTFMHEFGHNLNLRHGGNENLPNCKPNYISTMNYLATTSLYISSNPLDYSNEALASLNELNLNEPMGLTLNEGKKSLYNGPGLDNIYRGPSLTDTGVPVDFNLNERIDQEPVLSDLNGDFAVCPTVTEDILNGFNDWASPLQYITPPTGQAAVLQSEVPDEITTDEVRGARVDLLTGIDNAILRLGGEFNTFSIFEDLQQDQLDSAIAALLQLKAQVIEEFGQAAANKEVVPQIENLIGVLENQKYPSPPPESACATGTGNRVITGTSDPDTLVGSAVNNLINGLAGDDRINGCAGNDSINGNTDDDGIAGGAGHDALDGNEGDDVMQGDSGNDLLSGGPGINVLTGGPGRDSFVCSPRGETTVTDFVPGTDTMSGPCILAGATPSAAAGGAEMSTASSIPLEILPMPLPD